MPSRLDPAPPQSHRPTLSAIPALILSPPSPGAQALDTDATATATAPLAGPLRSAIAACVGASALSAAETAAFENGTALHEELIARGALSGKAYARLVSEWLDVPCVFSIDGLTVVEARTQPFTRPRLVIAFMGGKRLFLVDSAGLPPDELARFIHEVEARGDCAALTPPSVIDALDEQAHARSRLHEAVNGLKFREPDHSAATGWRRHQVLLPTVCAGLVLGGLLVLPEATLTATGLLMGLPFLSVTVLRLHALREVLAARRRRAHRLPAVPRSQLPLYTILVPLFRETEVLPALLAALSGLDYPAAKREVIILIEATDLAMQAALLAFDLPPGFRVLIVPEGAPRTKPRALNYGLQFARGEIVVVYDAEDRPHPAQLKRAAALFAQSPGHVACVQAQLNIYNPAASWFTRQFTIEYSALFDAVLPALERLELPVPLGGTSNHFRRQDLEEVGGWDPYNVTEDADLGIRLARRGRGTRILSSTTWEEAPQTWRIWLPQRTRWLKGWMQTWLVHGRDSQALQRDLGLGGRIGMHAVIGGLIVSALVQPLFLALLIYQCLIGTAFQGSDSALVTGLIWISWSNLLAGYVVSIIVGALSAVQRGRNWLLPSAIAMPLYWLLISLAAYRALYQLVRDPFVWEKTPHGIGQKPRAGRRSRR